MTRQKSLPRLHSDRCTDLFVCPWDVAAGAPRPPAIQDLQVREPLFMATCVYIYTHTAPPANATLYHGTSEQALLTTLYQGTRSPVLLTTLTMTSGRTFSGGQHSSHHGQMRCLVMTEFLSCHRSPQQSRNQPQSR